MNAGKLNEQVTAYAYSSVSDGIGGFSATEEVSFTAWANVRRVSSGQRADEGRRKREARYSVTMMSRIDWSASVDGPDFPSNVFKIVYRGRDLAIDGPPMESEDRMFVTFECSEQQS
jgi:head-tail adaptor